MADSVRDFHSEIWVVERNICREFQSVHPSLEKVRGLAEQGRDILQQWLQFELKKNEHIFSLLRGGDSMEDLDATEGDPQHLKDKTVDGLLYAGEQAQKAFETAIENLRQRVDLVPADVVMGRVKGKQRLLEKMNEYQNMTSSKHVYGIFDMNRATLMCVTAQHWIHTLQEIVKVFKEVKKMKNKFNKQWDLSEPPCLFYQLTLRDKFDWMEPDKHWVVELQVTTHEIVLIRDHSHRIYELLRVTSLPKYCVICQRPSRQNDEKEEPQGPQNESKEDDFTNKVYTTEVLVGPSCSSTLIVSLPNVVSVTCVPVNDMLHYQFQVTIRDQHSFIVERIDVTDQGWTSPMRLRACVRKTREVQVDVSLGPSDFQTKHIWLPGVLSVNSSPIVKVGPHQLESKLAPFPAVVVSRLNGPHWGQMLEFTMTHLAKSGGASMQERLTVGRSPSNQTLVVPVPVPDVHVESIPINKEAKHWQDRFGTQVVEAGAVFSITRRDKDAGWGSFIHLRAIVRPQLPESSIPIEIYIGPSAQASKVVSFPGIVRIDSVPLNQQDGFCVFACRIEHSTVVVTRSDANKGWRQHLVLRGFVVPTSSVEK